MQDDLLQLEQSKWRMRMWMNGRMDGGISKSPLAPSSLIVGKFGSICKSEHRHWEGKARQGTQGKARQARQGKAG